MMFSLTLPFTIQNKCNNKYHFLFHLDKKFLTFGYNLRQQTSTIVGSLGGLNIWGYKIISEEIKRMSYGCGKIEGDVLSWREFVQGNINTEIRKPATCQYARGNLNYNLV